MQEQQNEILSSLGMQYLSAGVMPSDDMLSAMGIDRATAQRYIALVMAQTAGSSGSSSGNRESGDDYKINSAATTAALGAVVGALGSYAPAAEITQFSQLSPYAQQMLGKYSRGYNYDYTGQQQNGKLKPSDAVYDLVNAYQNGSITAAEQEYIASKLGIDVDADYDFG